MSNIMMFISLAVDKHPSQYRDSRLSRVTICYVGTYLGVVVASCFVKFIKHFIKFISKSMSLTYSYLNITITITITIHNRDITIKYR